MSTPSDLHDHDLEERLRTLLRDRADAVTGPPPMLDEAVPVLVLGRRRPGWSTRRLAVAGAAACLVLVAAITIPRLARPDAEPVASGRPPAALDPASSLPPGTDLDSVPPVFTADGDARAVALAYLVDRLGGGDAEIQARLPGQLTLDEVPSTGSIVAFHWSQADDRGEGMPSGQVLLRRDDQWAVVTSITDGVSLDQISRVGDHVSGRPMLSPSVERVGFPTVDLLDLDGSAAPGAPNDPAAGAVLSYGNTSEGDGNFDVDVGREPVVVSVRIIGGQTLAISEVVLTSTTVAASPHPTLSLGAPAEIAGENLSGIWPGPADLDLPRSTPEEAIGTFFQAAIGESVVTEPLSDGQGLAGTPYRVTTPDGLTLRAHLGRDVDGTGWFVVQVVADPPETIECGLGGFGEDPSEDLPTASYHCPAVAGAASATIAYGDGRDTWIAEVAADAFDRGVGLTIAPRTVQGVLVVSRDASGRLVGIRGAHG